MIKKAPAVLLSIVVANFAMIQPAAAKTLFSDNSISILHGEDYELVPEKTLTTMTLEHVSGHTWGGLFFFVDRHIGKTENSKKFHETYGELSPKFTLFKPADGGFIKAVNLAGTYEHGSNSNGFSQDNALVGLGVDLNIPGMKYASISAYRAFNHNTFNSNDDNQITLTYGWTNNNVTLDGYVDYSFDNEGSEDQLHINPQLKYNIGSLFGTSNKIDAGIEYSYWQNKFGVKDKDQNAVSGIIKAHF